MPNLGPTELILTGFVLLIVAALVVSLVRSQPPSTGQRVLRRWGIEQPTEEQGEAAAAYLRTRRRRYLPIFLLLLAVAAVVRSNLGVPHESPWLLLVPGAIIASLLVGELSAMLRPALLSNRTAALIRRRVTDVVPLYGLLAYALGFAVVLVAVVVNLAAGSWAHEVVRFLSSSKPHTVGGQAVEGFTKPPPVDLGTMWLLLVALALVTLATGAVVWLGVRRGPVYDDRAVDAALRVRSARVATGCGLGLVIAMTPVALMRIRELANPARDAIDDGFPPVPGWLLAADNLANSASLIVLVCGVFCWLGLVSPIRAMRLVEVSR